MVWPPIDRVLISWLVATPLLLRLTGLPKLALSIWNCTVPVGVVLPELGMTVAVKVTLCPDTDGLTEEATAVVVAVVGLLVTDCVKLPLLGVKLLSPL